MGHSRGGQAAHSAAVPCVHVRNARTGPGQTGMGVQQRRCAVGLVQLQPRQCRRGHVAAARWVLTVYLILA